MWPLEWANEHNLLYKPITYSQEIITSLVALVPHNDDLDGALTATHTLTQTDIQPKFH